MQTACACCWISLWTWKLLKAALSHQHIHHDQQSLGVQIDSMRLSLDQLVDMEASEIGAALRHPGVGGTVRSLVDSFPHLSLEAKLQPVTRYKLHDKSKGVS